MASTSFFAYPLNPFYIYTTYPVYPTCKCCQPVQANVWAPPQPLGTLPKLPNYLDENDDDDTPTLYERSRSNSCDSLASLAETLQSQPSSPTLTLLSQTSNDLDADEEYTLATFFAQAAVYQRTFRERWWSAGPRPYTSRRILPDTVHLMPQPDLAYYGTYSRAWADQYYQSYPYAHAYDKEVEYPDFERMVEGLVGGTKEEEYWRQRAEMALNGRDESFLFGYNISQYPNETALEKHGHHIQSLEAETDDEEFSDQLETLLECAPYLVNLRHIPFTASISDFTEALTLNLEKLTIAEGEHETYQELIDIVETLPSGLSQLCLEELRVKNDKYFKLFKQLESAGIEEVVIKKVYDEKDYLERTAMGSRYLSKARRIVGDDVELVFEDDDGSED
ncbi:hypothetical protein HDU97_008382 [Phlyctochytrium planicorne]|nr:hypothetical protein HDU97_008382 [Phlyctochytrium planicorne]